MKTGAHRYVVGERFAALVIVALEPNGRARVRCDCGVEKSVCRGGLSVNGRGLRSCGCTRIAALRSSHLKHGHTTRAGYRSPEYYSWDAMVKRCTNPRTKEFAWYGGRGITICERWRSFTNFLADMGPRSAGTSIDRIDVNGNYEPGNCRWASLATQAGGRKRPRSGSDSAWRRRLCRPSPPAQ